ncbi:TRAP transporter large permease [Qingshengfaniella alkalisoli]|uniref:TRAP transporter large permease protein n=1 Tax=Qingshengfaniella alkalisoli TaxID=2599296 RepID=A0A5B8I6G5_9RHOB|nr:TRAP transporter large permease [Qingshengfaniella alkalisoli]QDY69009.1 TRAP transporter large permease [Qingshengfaniella alkalisoli]
MEGLALAGFGFVAMLTAIFLRVPVAAAMAMTGFFGSWIVIGTPNAALSQLKTLSYDSFASYSLSIVPLFLLMGHVATRSGISAALFRAASAWVGHRRGGIAMAAIGASAGFGAVCGSSLATAATMGQVALPEMRRRGYSDALSTGVLAAGGTLGILIPPSVILVIYAILTEQNLVKMFAAAMVPGVLAALGYIVTVQIIAWRKPSTAPTVERVPVPMRWKALASVWPVATIFALVMGGIIGDWDWSRPDVQALFTPTEGAAFGAVTTTLYAVMFGGLRWSGLRDAFLETAAATGMIFLILLGAQLFNSFLAFTQTPQQLAQMVLGSGLSPYAVMALILVFYLIFGCVMDSLSMILLTVPVFFPIIAALDFGLGAEETAIWFGILALIVVEVGLITPPVGMNLFIINRIDPDVPISETYRGVLPFIISDLIRVVLLIAFPVLTLASVDFLF